MILSLLLPCTVFKNYIELPASFQQEETWTLSELISWEYKLFRRCWYIVY